MRTLVLIVALAAAAVAATPASPAAAKERDDRPAAMLVKGVTPKQAVAALTRVMSESDCVPKDVNELVAVYEKHADLTNAAIAGAIAGAPSGRSSTAKHRLTFTIDEEEGGILIQNARLELLVNEGTPGAFRQDLTMDSRKRVQALLEKVAKSAKDAARQEARAAEAAAKAAADSAAAARADSVARADSAATKAKKKRSS